jgi:hypothetical protein
MTCPKKVKSRLTILTLILALGIALVQPAEAATGAVQPSPPVSPPGPLVVRVTSPPMNADVGAGADLALAAAGNGAITKVEFFDDNVLVGTVIQAPFTLAYHPAAPKLNFRITARVTDAAGHTAVSPPVTCVAAGGIQRKYRSFDYEEQAENKLKQVRVWIPDGLTTVRGLLVVCNPSNGDSRDWYKEIWYDEFLHLHDFAFLGTQGDPSHFASFRIMQRALQQIAGDAHHPELVNVPYAATGFSSGGGFASELLVEAPERVIASIPVCARLNLTGLTPGAAHLQTPACIISGEMEKFEPVVEPVLEAYRPEGALFGWMTVQNSGHGRYGQEVLAMPLLDATVRLRYPRIGDVRKGPVKLLPLDADRGWVADNTTWKSGLTHIAPARQFTGVIGKSSWLPTEDIAFIYRAYATFDRPLTITSPSPSWSGQRAWDPGSNVTIVVDDAQFARWRKLEFYDGAHKLGEINHGPPQLTAMDLAAGYHTFSVLGTDDQGKIRPSNPVLVVVRQLPAKH